MHHKDVIDTSQPPISLSSILFTYLISILSAAMMPLQVYNQLSSAHKCRITLDAFVWLLAGVHRTFMAHTISSVGEPPLAALPAKERLFSRVYPLVDVQRFLRAYLFRTKSTMPRGITMDVPAVSLHKDCISEDHLTSRFAAWHVFEGDVDLPVIFQHRKFPKGFPADIAAKFRCKGTVVLLFMVTQNTCLAEAFPTLLADVFIALLFVGHVDKQLLLAVERPLTNYAGEF